jgi:hypothetical protein
MFCAAWIISASRFLKFPPPARKKKSIFWLTIKRFIKDSAGFVRANTGSENKFLLNMTVE